MLRTLPKNRLVLPANRSEAGVLIELPVEHLRSEARHRPARPLFLLPQCDAKPAGFLLLAYSRRRLSLGLLDALQVRLDVRRGNRYLLELLPQRLLDLEVVLDVVLRDARHSHARSPDPGSPPDAVDVVLGRRRELEVDDEVDVWDIQAALGDVRAHQRAHLLRSEAVERQDAVLLRHLPHERQRAHPEHPQQVRHLEHDVRRRAEDHDDVASRERREVVVEVGEAVAERDKDEKLPKPIDGVVLVFGDSHDRRAHKGCAVELVDAGGHRRREEERLPLAGQSLHDKVQLGLVVHVEHLVRLVEHNILEGLEREPVGLLDVVLEPPGRGDDDVGPLAEVDRLLDHVDAAEDDDNLELGDAVEKLKLLTNLQRQLPSGHEDKAGQLRLGHEELLDEREGVGARLPTAGLGDADEVFALKNQWNAFELNLGGRCPLVFSAFGDDVGVEAKLVKCGWSGCVIRGKARHFGPNGEQNRKYAEYRLR